MVSCPRASTRLAFEHLAVDAVVAASSDPPKDAGRRLSAAGDSEGEQERQQQQQQQQQQRQEEEEEIEVDQQTTALARALLDLLQDESYGAARGESPGGLSHVAAVAAAAAAAASNTSQRDVLIAGRAVPLLLDCLKARHSHEIASSMPPPPAAASSTGASAMAVAVAAKAAAAAPSSATLRLQHVGGFGAVVSAVGHLLAGRGGVEEALGGGADAVLDREFLLAAIKTCPRQTADLLAHLVWRGPRPGAGEPAPAFGNGPAAAAATGTTKEETRGAGGDGGDVVVPGGGDVGERALSLLLEIVLDARRASSAVPAASAATAAAAAAEAGAVDLRSGMSVLSRVLHLNDDGVQGRLEVALRRLEAAVRESEAEGGPAAAGCEGTVYLAGKLVASLFVHLPEARAVLARMPFFAAAPPAATAGAAPAAASGGSVR